MNRKLLGRTGIQVATISYGGIVSAGDYFRVNYPELDQAASDRFVSYAIEHGVSYFDVAPSYGNAQEQLGNSLIPYRKNISLTPSDSSLAPSARSFAPSFNSFEPSNKSFTPSAKSSAPSLSSVVPS